jgi:thiol-disulfide isomerase/thioredoxin
MSDRSLLALLGLAAVALALTMTAGRRVSSAYAAEASSATDAPLRAGVGGQSLLLAAQQNAKADIKRETPTVREIGVEELKQLLQRDPKQARPLLVNFWATWCEPCREEFPDLVRLDTEFRARGLDFVVISLDDVGDIKTTVPEFLIKMRARMPAYLLNAPEPDTAIKAVDAEWSGALPATFLFDSRGQVVYKRLGRIKPEELRAAIKTVTSDK